MLIVNDYAFHQSTKVIGKVIGYGHRLVNDSYVPTLKVLIPDLSQPSKKHAIAEDLVSRWMPVK
jgi:hypothetical protein